MPKVNRKMISLHKEWEKYTHRWKPQKDVENNYFDFFSEYYKRIMTDSPIATLIINNSTSRYDFCSENISRVLGYSAKDFINGGLAFGMSLTDPEHVDHVADFIIPKIFEFIARYTNKEDLYSIQISYNYRMKKKDNTYVWVLQMLSFLEVDAMGYPLSMIAHLMEITHLKKDEKVDFNVSKKCLEGSETIYTSRYPEEDAGIEFWSRREIEILTLIRQGETSKSIADKLNLSIHTIHNHRKRMLTKSGCRNSSELINFDQAKLTTMFSPNGIKR